MSSSANATSMRHFKKSVVPRSVCRTSQASVRTASCLGRGTLLYIGSALGYFSYVFLSPFDRDVSLSIPHLPCFILAFLPPSISASLTHAFCALAAANITTIQFKFQLFGYRFSSSTSPCGSAPGEHLIRYRILSFSTHLTRRIPVFVAGLSYTNPFAGLRQRQATAAPFLLCLFACPSRLSLDR